MGNQRQRNNVRGLTTSDQRFHRRWKRKSFVIAGKSSLFIILFSFDIRSLVHEWKINDQRRRPSRFILLFDFYFWEMLTGNRLINLEERNLPVKEFSREASRIIN